VQGVGFRHATATISREHRVTGFVQNLRDGSVQLVAEGEAQALEGFLEAIRRAMTGCIVGCEKQDSPATGEFDRFSVRT
jgi:acylphosphatase